MFSFFKHRSAFVLISVCLSSNCHMSHYRYESVADGVVLTVVKQENDRIRLKLRNNNTLPIYLGYLTEKKTGLSSIRYRLVCNQNGTEADYGPEAHSGMGLSSLKGGDELDFETSRTLPAIKAHCYISVGYYSDIRAVELVRKFDSNPYIDLTDDEISYIDGSRQNAIVFVNVDNEEQNKRVR